MEIFLHIYFSVNSWGNDGLSSSVGIMKYIPFSEWKVIQNSMVPVTTNQTWSVIEITETWFRLGGVWFFHGKGK